jgi:hypothetical protein
MRLGFRRPAFHRRLAARLSPARAVRHRLKLKAPRGLGWATNPRRAAYNRVYRRTTVALWPALVAVLLALAFCHL